MGVGVSDVSDKDIGRVVEVAPCFSSEGVAWREEDEMIDVLDEGVRVCKSALSGAPASRVMKIRTRVPACSSLFSALFKRARSGPSHSKS